MIGRLQTDFVAYKSDQLVAAIELKNREGLTPRLAASLRRNLAEHGLIPKAGYFLLLSQDVGFLWVNFESMQPDA